jgi:hypothetical protein
MKKSILIVAVLLFLNVTIQAQEEKSEKIDQTQATGEDVKFLDEDTNELLKVIDEGDFGSIQLQSGVPTTTTNKLYNNSGTLHFNGTSLGGGSGVSVINDLNDAKYDGSSLFIGEGSGINDVSTFKGNTAIGKDALYSNTTGFFMTANGFQALYSNEDGIGNTANGFQALYSNVNGNYNTANGTNALFANETGDYNTANGYKALHNNTIGNSNTANGYSALNANMEGTNNTACGYMALYKNTLGNWNTGNGYKALFSNTIGTHNTATGLESLYSNTEGIHNTSFGYKSLTSNTTGDHNVGVGFDANRFNQEGSNNTIIGYQAGRGTTAHNKSGNVFIGYQAGYSEILSNKLYIENSSSSSPLIWGDFATDRVIINGNSGSGPVGYEFYVNGDAGGNEAWNNLSDGRLKENVTTISDALEKVKKLRGVTYDWMESNEYSKKNKIGFIAQEVNEVLPEVVDDTGEYMTMQYAPITALLVEAVQEQQEIIEELRNRIMELEADKRN